MNLSYQEKSIWGSLVAMLLVFGSYFASVRVVSRGPEAPGDRLGRIVAAVILLIVIEVVYHILIALRWKEEPKDERDRQIEAKAFRNAYLLLASGAFFSMVFVVIVEGIRGASTRFTVSSLLTIDVLLFFMVAAEVVKFLTQLFYYRRGI